MTVPDQRLQTGMGDPVPDVLRIWLEPFRGAFTAPTWRLVLVLVTGALLAPCQYRLKFPKMCRLKIPYPWRLVTSQLMRRFGSPFLDVPASFSEAVAA